MQSAKYFSIDEMEGQEFDKIVKQNVLLIVYEYFVY